MQAQHCQSSKDLETLPGKQIDAAHCRIPTAKGTLAGIELTYWYVKTSLGQSLVENFTNNFDFDAVRVILE